MGIPEIFEDDPLNAKLAGYFVELYDYLLEQGVPTECLPSPWHVLRHVTKAIDRERLGEWLDNYVAVEADPGAEEPLVGELAEEGERVRASRKYLRALGPAEEPGETP